MRILFWSETFWPRVGGVENLAAQLLPALQSRGYEFAVVTWENVKAADVIYYGRIPVYRFPFFSRERAGGVEPVIQIREQVMQLKQDFAPDLIHINSYGSSVLFHLNTNAAPPVSTLVTLHQDLPPEPVEHETLLGHLLRSAHWVTACSAAVLAHAREVMPEIADRSALIYNGIEPPGILPQPISFSPPRLLCLGRLVREKGFDLALAAFARVLDRFPTARLVIAGDGPERIQLQQKAIQLALAHSVDFLGGVPPETVLRLIDEATLAVIPSRLEGFGLVALEVALMARPVVATRVGGLPEVVLHEETGVLVETDNSAALAEAIMNLLNDPAKAKKLGQTARARAREVFSWERHVNSYDDLYRKLIMTPKTLPAWPKRSPFC